MLFLKKEIRTRLNLLLPELKSRVQDRIRKGVFEFRDNEFDIGNKVAVRVYRAADSKWKFDKILNRDGALHYTVKVQGTLVRRHVDQIRPVGDQVQENVFIPNVHRRFFRWRWKKLSLWQNLGIPGPKPNLIFGNLLELYQKGPLKCHEEWVKKYGRVLGYFYGMKPVLLVTDPYHLKNIFIKDFNKFINRE
ncbi:hypothetical protein AVEN_2691-1, partial [Araneus ventricosus]